MTNNKSQIISIIVLVFVFFISCSKLYRKETVVIEPVNVALIDESKIDNMDIRHIVKEFLLKGIIDQDKKWLTIFDLDTLSKEYIQNDAIEYFISLDIMDYGISDIETGAAKILVAVKITKSQTDNILAEFIEESEGNDIQQMGADLVVKLSAPIVNKLSSFQKRKFEVPNVLRETEDSTKSQE